MANLRIAKIWDHLFSPEAMVAPLAQATPDMAATYPIQILAHQIEVHQLAHILATAKAPCRVAETGDLMAAISGGNSQ